MTSGSSGLPAGSRTTRGAGRLSQRVLIVRRDAHVLHERRPEARQAFAAVMTHRAVDDAVRSRVQELARERLRAFVRVGPMTLGKGAPAARMS